MESQRFDQVVSSLAEMGDRRRVLGFLAASVGIGSTSLLRPDVDAKKKKKKTELCLNGQSVLASKKKKKKLLKQGATQGACPTSPPPGPPPGPPPPPTPNKSLMQDCTPGVDVCPVKQKCGVPTKRDQCSSTVQGHTNWCCVPNGDPCSTECGCCQDDPNVEDGYECDFSLGATGFCRPKE